MASGGYWEKVKAISCGDNNWETGTILLKQLPILILSVTL